MAWLRMRRRCREPWAPIQDLGPTQSWAGTLPLAPSPPCPSPPGFLPVLSAPPPPGAWHGARRAPAAQSRSQPDFLPAGLPRHVPRAPHPPPPGKRHLLRGPARARPRVSAGLRPRVTSRKGVRGAARRWGRGGGGGPAGAAAAAAGRGRCPFKVPPPRGRETACASPIPPGSARYKKHNA
ncbi:unnamed protein product [Nyctereutes procyonoides]|uniref:(raccoon dog) hypothetical protein n=1 Tax=Nyctereutes procyonoides TaxID=34880 RepID=A0A811XT19_NYCPR|nr:unnamed protein product [Nyctereutes procyonoides]